MNCLQCNAEQGQEHNSSCSLRPKFSHGDYRHYCSSDCDFKSSDWEKESSVLLQQIMEDMKTDGLLEVLNVVKYGEFIRKQRKQASKQACEEMIKYIKKEMQRKEIFGDSDTISKVLNWPIEAAEEYLKHL